MSFPAYPSYQDSGVDWLQHMPSNWSLTRVKALFEIVKNIAGSLGHDVLSITQSGIKVRNTDSNDGQLSMDYSKYQLVDPGYFAMNHMDLLTGWIDISRRHGVTSPDYRVFRTRDTVDIDCRFYLYLFQMAYSERLFYPFGQGSSQLGRWRLPTDAFDAFPLPMPPKDEQVAISGFLDRETAKIDALIEEQRRLVALLKEKRKAVISHAVTKGLDPHAPVRDSGIYCLGEVPAHWKVRRIKSVLDRIEQGWSPQCESEPVESPEQWGVLKVGCVNGGRFNPAENKTLPPELEPIPALSIRAGDILVSRANTRELVGSAALVEHDHQRLLLCDKLYRLGVKSAEIEAGFLAVYLQADVARGQIEVAATGASSSMVNIGQFVIREMPIATPPIEEQRSILAYLHQRRTAFDALMTEARAAVLLLTERRAALISAAVTGKIDVRQSATVIPFPIDRARARRLVATEILERLAHQATFGRTKLQKVVYLAEAHANITELAGCYIRMPYGPLDQPMMDEIEAMDGTAGFEIDDKRDRSMVRYRMTGKRGEHTEELRRWLGEQRLAKLDHLIRSLSDLKTHSAEAIATLYAVWNDALVEGMVPTDPEIISAFFEWHPEKGKNFRADELPTWLEWMRRNDVVPMGVGSKTQRQIGPLL